jgi:cupin 2 domain-containing protein
MTNLFSNLPPKLPTELFTALLEASDVRTERIVSHGHASPEGFWYDQKQNEWVVVLKGAAKLSFEDGAVEMRPGDFLSIPRPDEPPDRMDDAGRAADLAGGALREGIIVTRRERSKTLCRSNLENSRRS